MLEIRKIYRDKIIEYFANISQKVQHNKKESIKIKALIDSFLF